MKESRQQATYLGQSLGVAGDIAKYDTHVKQILANKELLSRIFKETISEIKEYSFEEIEQMIEGNPEVGSIPLDPGLTNKARHFGLTNKEHDPGLENKPKRIHGEGTEDLVSGEGATYFDIITRIRIPEKELVEIVVNVEAQKEYDPGYVLVTRGIYYAARLISSQRDKEFVHSNYDDIKKVYSIWICFDTKKELRNTITKYGIEKEDIYGRITEEERYDLLTVIFIRLGGEYTDYEKKTLQRLLSAIFSEYLTIEEKKKYWRENMIY